jgi:hypothetical protein
VDARRIGDTRYRHDNGVRLAEEIIDDLMSRADADDLTCFSTTE